MIEKIIDRAMELYADEKLFPEEWDDNGLIEFCEEFFAPAGKLK
jgi:preprotein translocase subunit SecA